MHKQAASLNSRLRSLRPQSGEGTQVPAYMVVPPFLGNARALPPYQVAALVRQSLAVRQPAALSPYQVLRLVEAPGPQPCAHTARPDPSVSLISNGGVNDAVGGATSGTLNLTQTAIGGNGLFSPTDGPVAVQQAHLLELTRTEPQPIILMPMQLAAFGGVRR